MVGGVAHGADLRVLFSLTPEAPFHLRCSYKARTDNLLYIEPACLQAVAINSGISGFAERFMFFDIFTHCGRERELKQRSFSPNDLDFNQIKRRSGV